MIPKTDTLQKLDIEWFKSQRKGEDVSIYLKDSTKIRLINQINQFRKDITKKDSPYKLTVLYDKETGEYRGGGLFFYSINITSWKVYDNTGNLKIYENESKNFPFSYEQLLAKMKREYNLDLEKEYARREYINVVRSWNQSDPLDRPGYVIVYELTKEELKTYQPDSRIEVISKSEIYPYNPPRRYIFVDGRIGKLEFL